MTLFMETTEIPPEKTVAEIQTLLARNKVKAVMSEFENGAVSAVAFVITIGANDVPFRLPCRWRAISEMLRKRAGLSDFAWKSSYQGDVRRREAIELKAKRVAWRQILRWVQAQLALVETNMVKLEEVFLPYRQAGPSGETVFEMIEARGVALLEGPK